MKKLLLAINHKETEETIKTMVRDDFLCVGTATYKEAVLYSFCGIRCKGIHPFCK